MTVSDQEILAEWGVEPTERRDWDQEICNRVSFLKEQMVHSGRFNLVLGISGGVDSLVAGRLCQMAAESLREDGQFSQFMAVRLPYGEQSDETAAQSAIDFIHPDEVDRVNIKPASDAIHESVLSATAIAPQAADSDFALGNVKARVRMAIQYDIAGLHSALVVGTDHNAEGVTGFFTKWGDGACDILPLRGLNKRQVRLLGKALGASSSLYDKPATADLESLRPQLSDEQALGIDYNTLDDFLEGKSINDSAKDIIKHQYEKTQHKRQDPPAAAGDPLSGE